jgi:hypothetical protein
MLSGGSKQGSSSSLDYASLITGLAGTATGNGGGSSAGNAFASVGNALGSLGVPGAGLVGSAIGGLVNFVGGKPHVPDGAGKFAGLHSPTLASFDDSLWFKEDCDTFVFHAKSVGISVEEVGMYIAAEVAKYGDASGVFAGFQSRTSFITAEGVRLWNQAHPEARIEVGKLGPSNLRVSSVKALQDVHGSPEVIDLPTKLTTYGNDYEQGVSPGTSIYSTQAAQYTQGVPLGTPIQTLSSAAGLVSQALSGTTGTGSATFNAAASAQADKGSLLEQLIKAMTEGAKSGAVDVLADTDAAKAAKADYFKEFVAKYQLPLAGGGIGLFLLIKKAFFDNA